MNPERGSIAKFETDDDAKAAGYTVPLTNAEARKLAKMPRDARKAWAQQRAFNAQSPGLTDEQARQVSPPFVAARAFTSFPSPWHRENQVPYVTADIWKRDRRWPGEHDL